MESSEPVIQAYDDGSSIEVAIWIWLNIVEFTLVTFTILIKKSWEGLCC